MDAVKRQFQPIGNSKLVVHLAQIVLHHLLGGPNLIRDFFVTHSLRDARNDEQLFI